MLDRQAEQLTQFWSKKATDALKGKVISHIAYQYPEQLDELGWTMLAPVIVFEDGTQIIATTDAEENEAGAFRIIKDDIENVVPPI